MAGARPCQEVRRQALWTLMAGLSDRQLEVLLEMGEMMLDGVPDEEAGIWAFMQLGQSRCDAEAKLLKATAKAQSSGRWWLKHLN